MKQNRYVKPIVCAVALGTAGALVAGPGPDRGFTLDAGGSLTAGGPSCPARPLSFAGHVVTTDSLGARAVATADMNGDGDLDIVAASLIASNIDWYENDGGSPPTFSGPMVIDPSLIGAQVVLACDLDGDLDTDVFGAGGVSDTLAWYENDGGDPPSFTKRVISTAVDNPQAAFAADVDDDGDIDILVASANDDTVAWWANDGNQPPTFTENVITSTLDRSVSVHAVDMDNDMDLDVLATARSVAEWYESDGGAPPTFTTHTITNKLAFSSAIYGADLDGDGDGDAVVATLSDRTLAWFEQVGGAFTRHVIDTDAGRLNSVTARDLDLDLAIDVVVTDTPGDRIHWYQNDGGSPPSFSGFPVTNATNDPRGISVDDMDGDLDLDIVAVSFTDNKVSWYEQTELEFGVCCLTDGTCSDNVCLADCAAVFGWRWEPNLTCDNVTCPGNDDPAAFLVERLSADNFRQVVCDLAAFGTRYWNRPGNSAATMWLQEKLESFGYDNVTLDPYMFQGVEKFNVYATKIGKVRPTEMYILGGHFDSFNINGNFDDAPGADDDASGVSSVLEMARVFANVETDVSIRFVCWNNEETGLNGSRAYVENHKDLQGTMDEPTWLGMIQQDMILWDHGPGKVPDADVEYQANADADGRAIILGSFVNGAVLRYGFRPSELSSNMRNTDSVPFMTETVAISVRENTRDEIGNGSQPCWHFPCDNCDTYQDEDFAHGFNILSMVCGAVGELVNARPAPCGGDVTGDGQVNFADLLAILRAWGPCKACPEDIDNSGIVDFGDLLVVLREWGPCP